MHKKILLFVLCCTFPLLAEVENSIVPLMDRLVIKELSGKISGEQFTQTMEALGQRDEETLRIVSFNMLFNLPGSEEQLESENRWVNRAPRLSEYLRWVDADIIGSQELQKDQLDAVMAGWEGTYGFYGIGIADGREEGDITAIFYRKERLELLEGRTFYFSETPCQVSYGPFGAKNTFTVCLFRDLHTGQVLKVVNTHLAFRNPERRSYEAKQLRDYLRQAGGRFPLIVMGDFNTFPFRQELDTPFYDGERIVALIEESGVEESARKAILGHFGPISSTNFCAEEKKAFCSLGTPGVILDHIFVSDRVKIFSHGIDPATVNGYWPSDHFPVIVECVLLFEEVD